jgi:DNA-binding CsgD family transcriptional regulator
MESRLDPTLVLTDRKVGILRQLAAGRNVREIAVALGISVYTVYEHMGVIRRRLGAHSNPELVRIGLRHGFISAEDEQS